jgi:hypothetical protein
VVKIPQNPSFGVGFSIAKVDLMSERLKFSLEGELGIFVIVATIVGSKNHEKMTKCQDVLEPLIHYVSTKKEELC